MAETRHMLPDWARSVLSLAFLFFVAFATAGNRLPLFIAIMVSAALAIVAIQLLFPVGRLFSIAFANLIAVYAAIFSLFAEEVFGGVDPALLSLGFSLPIFAFVAAFIGAFQNARLRRGGCSHFNLALGRHWCELHFAVRRGVRRA